MLVKALTEERGGLHRPVRRESVLELIGQTPLVKLEHVTRGLPDGVEVWAKLESANPGGSNKDRAAREILESAVARGDLARGDTAVDYASGNMGIAYAMVGAALGVRMRILVPPAVSEVRRRIIAAYGAEVTECADDDRGAAEIARLIEGASGKLVRLDYTTDPANARAHELTTAHEIWEQTKGRVTHFVCAMETSGTVVGVSRGLKSASDQVRVVACQPADAGPNLPWLRRVDEQPGTIWKADGVDEVVTCTVADAREMAARLAREEALAAGDSSGANVWAALDVASRLEAGVVVTLVNDHHDRYLG